MEPFGLQANCLALLLATLLSTKGMKKKSLTGAGAAAAFAVGYLLLATGLRGMNLIVFYLVGTKATKFKKEVKKKIDGSITAQGGSIARGAGQVLACSILAVVLSLIHAIYCGKEERITFSQLPLASSLTCGIVAHHATCLADTLASELGILSQSSPRLVTQPWKTVPPGTNGGVTLFGTLCSALGGLLIGLSTILFDTISGIQSDTHEKMSFIAFSTCCGLLGSLIDSFLGATIQQTYFDPDSKLVYQENDEKPASTKLVAGTNILTNEQVNLVSVGLTTFLGGWVLGPLFFG